MQTRTIPNKTLAIKPAPAAAGFEKRKTTKTPDDERLILIRMADGSQRCCTVSAFKAGLRAGIEETLSPLRERIDTLAAVVKDARPVTVKRGVNRGRMKRGIVVAPYKGGNV